MLQQKATSFISIQTKVHYLLLIVCFLFSTSKLSAQSDVVQIGILPSTYADGMPIEEFKKFENNVIKHLVRLERFEVVRNKGAYKNIELNGGLDQLRTSIQREGKNVSVPYLFQLSFGDTEWTSNPEGANQKSSIVVKKEPVKETTSKSKTAEGKSAKSQSTGKERTVVSTEKKPLGPTIWTQDATMWVTLSVYEVATGALINNVTIRATSMEFFEFKRASATYRSDYKNAASAAQKSMWKKVKNSLKTIFPLDVTVRDIIDQKDDKVLNVTVNAGSFHGIELKDKIYVYYEKEYLVRGEKTMRHVEVAKLVVEEVNKDTAVCKVKKGGKDIAEALSNDLKLKCTIPTAYMLGYGF